MIIVWMHKSMLNRKRLTIVWIWQQPFELTLTSFKSSPSGAFSINVLYTYIHACMHADIQSQWFHVHNESSLSFIRSLVRWLVHSVGRSVGCCISGVGCVLITSTTLCLSHQHKHKHKHRLTSTYRTVCMCVWEIAIASNCIER